MFIGEYTHSIDDKGRLAVPRKFRNGLVKGAVVTKGLDNCFNINPAYFFFLPAFLVTIIFNIRYDKTIKIIVPIKIIKALKYSFDKRLSIRDITASLPFNTINHCTKYNSSY